MPEDQKNVTVENISTTPVNADSQSTIDFSKFWLSAWNEEKKEEKHLFGQPSVAEPVAEKSVMSQLNSQAQEKKEDVEISNLNIEESKQKDQKKVELWTSWIWEEKKGHKISHFEVLMLSYIVLGISIVAALFVGIYGQYFKLAIEATTDVNYVEYIEKYKGISKTISKYTNINDYNKLSLDNALFMAPNADDNLNGIINNPRLNYIQKKDIIQNNITSFSSEIINNKTTLNNLKSEINLYGFMPKDLYDTIQKQEWISNIKNSMILQENIKFITAFKAFGYMHSFVYSFSSFLNKNPLDVEEKLNLLNSDGEKQIITYTNNCYFNPYEISYDCDNINDFDNYYKLIDPTDKTKLDLTFLKKLAYYVDTKLQQTDIPTFWIIFSTFDPKQDNVSFTIDLNTNPEDEIALSKQWILNPHLYVVTNLINLLRESLLIIWENIKADQVKITPKIIRIWSTTFTVNNTSLNLTVPIQKQNQREISDFFMSNK